MGEDRLLGKILDGRYKILDSLGSGGMGAVYKAREITLERLVAVKVLHDQSLFDDDTQARFEREALVLSSLSHQHIVSFYRFGVSADGLPYIVTEYLEGITLRSVFLAKDATDWRRLVHIFMQVCEALQFAHDQGVIHRDLKPENIMLTSTPEPDYVKLLDFGLARSMSVLESEPQVLTRTGQLVGSVNYMSPEQCMGKRPDSRADIYALACILYESLLGEAPFIADTPMGVIYKHVHETPKAFSSYAAALDIPAELESICAKAMSKEASQRYASIDMMKNELQALLTGKADSLQSVSSKLTATGFLKNPKAGKPVLFSLVVLTLAVFLGAYLWLSRKSEKQANSIVQRRTANQIYDKNARARVAVLERKFQRLEQELKLSPGEQRRDEIVAQLFKYSIEASDLSTHTREFEIADKWYARFLALKAWETRVSPDPEMLQILADTQSYMGRFEDAEKNFEAAIAILHARADSGEMEGAIRCRQALMKLRLGDVEGARKYFHKALMQWQSMEEVEIKSRLMARLAGGRSSKDVGGIKSARNARVMELWNQILLTEKRGPAFLPGLLPLNNDIAEYYLKQPNENEAEGVFSLSRSLAGSLGGNSAVSSTELERAYELQKKYLGLKKNRPKKPD